MEMFCEHLTKHNCNLKCNNLAIASKYPEVEFLELQYLTQKHKFKALFNIYLFVNNLKHNHKR